MIATPLKPDEAAKEQAELNHFSSSEVDIRLIDDHAYSGRLVRTVGRFLVLKSEANTNGSAQGHERLIPWSSVVYIQKVVN